MSEGLQIALITLLVAPLGYVVGWFVNRKTNISMIYKNITEAAENSVETMSNAMERLTQELESASAKIEHLQTEIAQLRQQNLLLLQENHSLHRKIDDLRAAMGGTGPIPRIPSDPAS
jgi:predicted  nucleic acid-binding Zn-ribbon protein